MAGEKQPIKVMRLSDGSAEFDVENLTNEALKKISLVNTSLTPPAPDPATGKTNNLIVGTISNGDSAYGLKNTDIKAVKGIRLYYGADEEIKIQSDSDQLSSKKTSKDWFKQVQVKCTVDKDLVASVYSQSTPSKDPAIRLKVGCNELELNGQYGYEREKGTGKFLTSVVDHMDIVCKNDNDYMEGKFKAKAIDIRAIANSNGRGGGVAIQIASCDGDYRENKFKLETSRKKDIFDGLATSSSYSEFYNVEGGTGIEIGTVNSQFESYATKEIRRHKDSNLFAVTRSEVKMFKSDGSTTEDPSEAKKWDYATQSDDSKDIKDASQATVKWVDLINAALYLKANGSIPSDGSIYQAVDVELKLGTGVTSTNPKHVITKGSAYTTTLTGATAVTVTVNGTSHSEYISDTNVVTIPESATTGKIVIEANA